MLLRSLLNKTLSSYQITFGSKSYNTTISLLKGVSFYGLRCIIFLDLNFMRSYEVNKVQSDLIVSR